MLNENVIKTTTNYGMFKRLEGNREVSKQRKMAIFASIRENGYIGAPILVNEKMEVIDGQGRLAACEELGIPIPFCVKNGTDVKSCMILNQNTRNWTDEEYVKSYARQGDPSYKFLLILMEDFGVGCHTAIFASKGVQSGGGANSIIRRGLYNMTQDEYWRGRETLNQLMPLMPYIKSASTHTQRLSFAIMYAINNSTVDYERLRSVMAKKAQTIASFTKMEEMLGEISRIYNYGLRSGRIYLREDYDREKREKI